VQNPNILLTILSSMACKPEVKFEKLFPKLYNIELWLMAYQSIAPKPGNMTNGVDGSTIDATSRQRIERIIADLKASRYTPNPVRRVYIPKANGKLRPLGIPSFEDKLLQTVVKFLLEAIYEPAFSPHSHGFRPNHSCHTALEQVKRMHGVRWWVEGDIQSFFDQVQHDILLGILSKRITDKRFLHLIGQFLKAGYVEMGQTHPTYSGTPQGGNLSPLLANIYLHELDQAVARRQAEFNQGKHRRARREYRQIQAAKLKAKAEARQTGDWMMFKRLQQQQLATDYSDPFDPNFRRLEYVRYADDFLLGINGSKSDALELKTWLTDYLRTALGLELSAEKTLVTNAKDRVRFLSYNIQRWGSTRVLRTRHPHHGVSQQRTNRYQFKLSIPRDKVQQFVRTYGTPQGWHAESRPELIHYSELEIVLKYNAEIRGFLNYYALADDLSQVAADILWITTNSFLKTLANKRKSHVKQVVKSLKMGPNTFIVTHRKPDGTVKEYRLFSSTRQLRRQKVTEWTVDYLPYWWQFRTPTELGQRLNANQCEWCGTTEGKMEVHHVRRLRDLKGKSVWEVEMIGRQRKTLVLCRVCHDALHAGKLTEATRQKNSEKTGEPDTRKRVRPVRGGVL